MYVCMYLFKFASILSNLFCIITYLTTGIGLREHFKNILEVRILNFMMTCCIANSQLAPLNNVN